MKIYKYIDIDFETKSLINIMAHGAYRYATHESTRILIIAWSFDGKTVDSYNPFFDPIEKLLKFIKRVRILLKNPSYKIRAFNSMFEYLIWNYVGVSQFSFPKLKISQTYCVMAESCAMSFPASLTNAALACSNIQKNKDGSTLISFFCKPISKKNQMFRCPEENPERFKQFIQYCEDDVSTQIGVSNACNTLTPFQYRMFLLTERMNLRGLPIDTGMITGALSLITQAKEQGCKSIAKLTKNKVNSPTQNKVLLQWLNDTGCAIPNLQAATIDRWLKDKKLKKSHKRALVLRIDGSKSSVAKYIKAQEYLTSKDIVHDFLKYHIATTGRWGGRGIQIHNFPKPHKNFPKWFDREVLSEAISDEDADFLTIVYGSVSESLKAGARSFICAPKGKKFVSADYSQIEARIVMWLANSYTGISDFAGAGKIYESMAGVIFNINTDKIAKPSFERDVGKEAVLGCGFGMGWARFLSTCVEKRGLDVNKEIAERAVKEFRSRYTEVPATWKECSKQAILAIKNPNTTFEACNGKLTYWFDGMHLYACLPSGRKLTYPYAFIDFRDTDWGVPQESVFFFTWNNKAKVGENWAQKDIWGGTLFQHCVQAIAADIMANGMLMAEKNKYTSIFTVHDESVALVEDSERFSYKDYENILCKLPKWTQGLLIIAEGWEGKRYRK